MNKHKIKSFSQILFRHFNSGIVDPPSTNIVKRTIISVVVTMTRRVSISNSRWSDNAYAMAPRRPLNHIMNIYTNRKTNDLLILNCLTNVLTIFLVILCWRKRFTRAESGNIFTIRPRICHWIILFQWNIFIRLYLYPAYLTNKEQYSIWLVQVRVDEGN